MKLLLLFYLFLQALALPQPPNHSFEKPILVSKNTLNDSDNGEHQVETKKVFVTLVIGPYSFKKRREKGDRVTFSCNGCQRFKHYLPAVAVRERLDSNPENDRYELDLDTVPSNTDHMCGNSGIEEMVKKFRKEIDEEIKLDPTQPFPALYLKMRSVLIIVLNQYDKDSATIMTLADLKQIFATPVSPKSLE